jgi:hypothetical protein
MENSPFCRMTGVKNAEIACFCRFFIDYYRGSIVK